ncbi:phage resistance protein [Catellatospora sichuanensis]|uniref:phage resistance protein n=1 Tax=Catellatospora sichuanensis TaxID=1969805 RepID=UPI00118276EF|nr:phage resistance protein [Catellatospora sichuanensis]
MTLMRDLIRIPTSVSEGDFVVRASEGADLANYVVTDDLRGNFTEALQTIGHAVTTSRSQAKFLHGSFGAGKSHFMSVLREILKHNPQARAIRGLAEPVASADAWLPGKKLLCLTFHMLDARSVEQAVLEGYLRQIAALHPDAPTPAVHRSDALLRDAANLRQAMGDDAFFGKLGDDTGPAATGQGLAAMMARAQGWTPQTYDAAAAAAPGTAERDSLVSALTRTFFTGAVQSGEYLDLDTGLQVITRHAKSLGYDAAVLFLDELILWLSTKIADHTFVNTEGAKLNKLVESSDAARPLPLVSFVARQRNLEEFLGPQVGGTEREALAHVMRSVQGRFGEIVLADTNLPEITEKRLLRPVSDEARRTIDDAFTAVRNRREVWDTLLLGAQYGDAGIGSDAAAFRRLYPFSPALVATLVALSQALQRERTALRVMTELLVACRDTLAVNDLIGVSALFDPLVLHGELPDRPKLRQQFRAARDTYTSKLRPLLLAKNGIAEEQAASHEQFQLDDKLIKTLLLGALVPDVPALHNLTASRLHALNFGSISSPVPGYENQIVIDRLTRLSADAGEIHKTEGADPVFSLKLSSVDYDKLLELVGNEETTAGVLQGLIRDLTTSALGLRDSEEVLGEYVHQREWRGRRHRIGVKFGNIRNRETMPDSALYAEGDTWRIVVDYPFDTQGHSRRDDLARIEGLERGSRTVFWLPYFLTDELMGRVAQLAKINYLLGVTGTGEKLNSLAADWSQADRQQGRIYLQQRQQQLRSSLADSLKQAYGVIKSQAADVELDQIPVFHTLADGLQLGDPRGGTMDSAFAHLTADVLRWSYPGTPALPEDEKPVTKAELAKVWHYAKIAAAAPDRAATIEQADRRILQRICNHLRLGELVENRYVLTNATCWWSQHLLQEAAKQDFRDHFPVHVLRDLLDEPAPRGFERDLQNMVIAVFALEQQLAWYRQGGKLELSSLQEISDQLELRHPPMPEPEVWDQAVKRARPLFGKQVPEWRSPAALAEFAAMVRGEAKTHAPDAQVLLKELSGHAKVLGLDQEAKSGRLATARRVAKLLHQISNETDDVVLVSYVAEAEVGDIDDLAASVAYKKASAVTAALARMNWPLVDAVISHSAANERARVIVDKLRIVAANDQHAGDLVAALHEASIAATAFLADLPSVVVDPDPDPVPDGKDGDDPVNPPKVLEVRRRADLDDLLSALQGDLTDGGTIRVTWEILR